MNCWSHFAACTSSEKPSAVGGSAPLFHAAPRGFPKTSTLKPGLRNLQFQRTSSIVKDTRSQTTTEKLQFHSKYALCNCDPLFFLYISFLSPHLLLFVIVIYPLLLCFRLSSSTEQSSSSQLMRRHKRRRRRHKVAKIDRVCTSKSHHQPLLQ